jgi:glycosyltransferase involved in cell wall biosynthesis
VLARLLAAWRDLPELPLLVVGGGEPRYLQELRRGAPPNVQFCGPRLPGEVARLFGDAALAVFTPRAEEFGIAPLEAMAAGLPVVAWREGGLVESVVDGRTGYLVADVAGLRQRVRQLMSEPGLRRELGATARRRAEEFGWARAVARMEDVCLEIARGGGVPGGGPG